MCGQVLQCFYILQCSENSCLSVSPRWAESTAWSALHLESHCTSDSFKTQSSLCWSIPLLTWGCDWVWFEKSVVLWWRQGGAVRGREKGRQGEEQGDRQKWQNLKKKRSRRRKEHWYGRSTTWVSVFLSTTHLPSAPAAVCICALPKTSNPLFKMTKPIRPRLLILRLNY